MLQVLAGVWALLLGMALIMIGNGMQSTLVGVRGGIEGFSTLEMSVITSGYFVGFLAGSRAAPRLIRNVGHVRVFAALGSLISAALVAFPLIAEPVAWTLLRVLLGFCLSGVYVTAESWLNNAATNRTRGKALSAYMIAQMTGLIAAQGLLTLGDAGGFALFIVPSILVSISFTPILLSVAPTPPFATAKPMSLKALFRFSPLGTVGMLILGGVFAAQFGMAAIYGTTAGLSASEVAAFVAAIFTGALILQYPVGWLSDRVDRRFLILGLAAVGAVTGALGFVSGLSLAVLIPLAFVMGGMANPLYSLLIAYTNDYLGQDDMAAASGGLVFIYGLGAIAGPLLTGQLMEWLGPEGFWLFVAALFAAIALYALWRATRRPSVPVEETGAYVGVVPTSSPVALASAQAWAADQAGNGEEAAGEGGSDSEAEDRGAEAR